MNFSALQHSALLQSLGWAIANSLWQALSLWIVYQFIQFAYKNSSSRFKNNVSTLLLFSVFIWFALTFLHKYIVLQSGTTVNSFSQAGDEYLSLATTFNWSSIIEKVLSALPFLSIGYLFLLVTLSIRLINSYVHIYYIRKDGLIKPPAQWRLFAEKVSLHMGMSKKICLWFSENVDVPATVGFLKPFILIPLASINQLTPEQLEAVILHELSHIRRNDYLINLFISIIETILFFNPFVVLLSSIIKRERENCCDDFVIQYQYDRHSYASALLSLEQTRTKNIRLSQAATSGKKQLLGRIQRIMEVSNSNNINYGQKLLALLFITALISSIAWLSPEKKVKIIHTATPTTMEKKNLPLINHTEKKKNSPATPLSKITTIKTITNKIANALEKVSSKPGAKHTDELTGNMEWKSTDEDNSFTNTFTEPPKKEIKSKDGNYSFNNIQSELKNEFLFAPKNFQRNNILLWKQLEELNLTKISQSLEKLSIQLNVAQLEKIRAQVSMALENVFSGRFDDNNMQPNIQQKKKAIHFDKHNYDTIQNLIAKARKFNYQNNLPGSNNRYEFHYNQEQPRAFSIPPASFHLLRNKPGFQEKVQQEVSPVTKTPASSSTIPGRVKIDQANKKMQIDFKDGMVLVNGMTIKNLSHPPSIEVNRGIVVISNGNKIIEINVGNDE